MPANVIRGQEWEAERTDDARRLMETLFPIHRSLTGEGVRKSLRILQDYVPFKIGEIASGTSCFDWTVPEEWTVREAYLADPSGNRLVDFHQNNLHLVHYSVPVNAEMGFEELRPHLHSLADLPQAIPYRTSYYERNWGFCLPHEQLLSLDRSATYRVVIDTELKDGSLTYGESLLAGRSPQEYLLSTYCCHPSLANDNLSGLVLWALLLREMSAQPRRNSYRFIVVPETVGAIAYLARNEEAMRRIQGGFVISTVAGPGRFGYKQTFLGDDVIDRVARRTKEELGLDSISYPFDVNGSDERQFSAPHFRIPMGTICKDKYYEYEYYHTSLDNLDFARPEALVQTLRLYLLSLEKLEMNRCYRSRSPKSEPMLGRRGLYPAMGGLIKQKAADRDRDHADRPYAVSEERSVMGNELDAIRWVLFYGDGVTPLLDVAERSGCPMALLHQAAQRLAEADLLEEVLPDGAGS